jgi:alpha-tubulin suppressor-like RCC1 family protein
MFVFLEKVPALESVHVIDIVVGAEHTLALSEDGKVWAWGNNSHGQVKMTSFLSTYSTIFHIQD